MRSLGEVGAGNFYFLEDPKSVLEVFRDEVRTFLFPVALEARINVSVASAYQLRGAYGTSGWRSFGSGGSVEMPSLFLAGRTSSEEPIDSGRRGGGGAILLELVAKQGLPGGEPPDVGALSIEWIHPTSGVTKSENVEIIAPHGPGEAPGEGFFSDKTVEKGFVMLNIYAAFKLATELAYDSDPRTARRTLEVLRPNVSDWLGDNDDADIEDDLRYVDMFITNLGVVIDSTEPYTPADPPNPWPAD